MNASGADDIVTVSVSRDSVLLFSATLTRDGIDGTFGEIIRLCDLSGVPPTAEARTTHVSLAFCKLVSFFEVPDDEREDVEEDEVEAELDVMNEIAVRALFLAESNDPALRNAVGVHAAVDGSVLSFRGFDDPDAHMEFMDAVMEGEEEGRSVTLLN